MVGEEAGGARAPFGSPFLRRSGFPFLTVPMNMSPGDAPGNRFRRAPQPAGVGPRRASEVRGAA